MHEQVNNFKIPEDIYEVAPDLRIFDKLIRYEKVIDKLIAKKREDIQE